MEKVTILEQLKLFYKKFSDLDLLNIWSNDEYEYKMFLKETGLTDRQVKECIKNEETVSIFDKIVKFAEGCDLKFCTQCAEFVDKGYYINSAEQCVDCAIGNGV